MFSGTAIMASCIWDLHLGHQAGYNIERNTLSNCWHILIEYCWWNVTFLLSLDLFYLGLMILHICELFSQLLYQSGSKRMYNHIMWHMKTTVLILLTSVFSSHIHFPPFLFSFSPSNPTRLVAVRKNCRKWAKRQDKQSTSTEQWANPNS